MRKASGYLLDGFELRIEAQAFHFPERFTDKRGAAMWKLVTDLIETNQ
jgi:hypothetical protein